MLCLTPQWAGADDPDNCLLCHQYRGLGRYNPEQDAVHLYFTSPDYQHDRLGAHARIACTDCHDRSEVSQIPHKPVSRVDCTKTCHLHNVTGIAWQFSHRDADNWLNLGVHNPETLSKLEFSNGPLLNEGQAYCLYCHDEPLYRDPTDIIPEYDEFNPRATERCDVCHADQIPIDTRFQVRHVASRLVHARRPLEMAQTCSVCHSDPLIRKTYELQDASVRYASTFHGKAALLGELDTADCISCHIWPGENAHAIRAASDPASITNPTNKADSCRSVNCHPGADATIGQAAVHLDLPSLSGIEIILAVAFIFFTLMTFGPSLVLTVLELFQIVIGRHVAGEERMRQLTLNVLRHPEGRERLRRFTPGQRWQHWILALLFAALVVTGFPMKFASHTWSRYVIESLGGLSNARTIHHYAGVLLVFGFLAHLTHVIVRMLIHSQRRGPDGRAPGVVRSVMGLPMFVGPQDALKMLLMLGYLMGLRKKPPTFGRFTIDQKFEYLGVFWGTMLLGITGLLLWDTQISSRFVNGRVFNLALIAHTYEAFLAVIHVGILHICNVVFAPTVFPFSPATLTGDTPVTRLHEMHSDMVIEVAKELGVEVPPEVENA